MNVEVVYLRNREGKDYSVTPAVFAEEEEPTYKLTYVIPRAYFMGACLKSLVTAIGWGDLQHKHVPYAGACWSSQVTIERTRTSIIIERRFGRDV